jgi:hypothetical protein
MAHLSDFVTIVSGLPRSGTSMMMRMLEAGGLPVLIDHVREADADNPRGYYEFEAVKKTKEDASWLADAPGRAVKMVYRLLYDLPGHLHYRVVFMRRKLDEVLASQQVMLDRMGKSAGTLEDQKVAELFRSQLQKYEEWIVRQPNFSVLDVSYNELLETPAEPVEQINVFLGGGLDVAAMREVVEPSLYRNRR